MAKQKTHKGLSKRVKITAAGKIKRQRAGSGHLMSGKNAKRKRRVTGTAIMTGKMAKAARAQIT